MHRFGKKSLRYHQVLCRLSPSQVLNGCGGSIRQFYYEEGSRGWGGVKTVDESVTLLSVVSVVLIVPCALKKSARFKRFISSGWFGKLYGCIKQNCLIFI